MGSRLKYQIRSWLRIESVNYYFICTQNKCSQILTQDERKIRDLWENQTFIANVALKIIGIVLISRAKLFKSIAGRSSRVVIDVLLIYYAFYMWLMSNAMPYAVKWKEYFPLVEKWMRRGLPIEQYQGYDITQIDVRKCKFYEYDKLII